MKKMLKLLFAVSIITGLISFAGICSFAEEVDGEGLNILKNFDYDMSIEDSFEDDIDILDNDEDDVISDDEEFSPMDYEYNVIINGWYVSFEDAVPVNVNGRIMVPFRAILEDLGAEVNYDSKTKKITATLNGIIVSFAVGESDLNVNINGKKSSKKMDVIPYIDPDSGRTYVSTRFISESLGYSVGWDAEEKTVIIIDYDSLFYGADSDFSIIDGFLKSIKPEKDTVYNSTTELTIDADVEKSYINLIGDEEATKDVEFNLNMSSETVFENNESNTNMLLSANFIDLLKAFGQEKYLSDKDHKIVENLENLSMDAIMDSKNLYFKTNIDSEIDKNAGDNTFFKLDFSDISDVTGNDMSSIIKGLQNGSFDSISSIIEFLKKEAEDSMTVSTYDDLYFTYEEMYCTLSDDEIKTKNTKDGTVYTIDFSKLKDSSIYDKVKGKAVIKEKDGEYTAECDLKLQLEDVIKISINMDSNRVKSEAVVEKIPEDAEIIDASSFLNDLGTVIKDLTYGDEGKPEYEYNVMINSQYVDFEDAEPVNVNGRIMVPFRAVLEKLGAEVDYDEKTKEISAVLGDTTISFAAGKSDLTIIQNGKKSSKKMDVVPYIDPASGRTYVSSRFAAESLGYNVGWDSDEKTVIIIDYDRIFKGIDTDFSIANDYLKSCNPEKDATYSETVELAVGTTIYKSLLNLMKDEDEEPATKDFKLNLNLNGESVTLNNESCMSMELNSNLKELMEILPMDEELSDEEAGLISGIDNLTALAYVNMDSNDLYFKTNIDTLIDERATDDSWFKINLADLSESSGIDVFGFLTDFQNEKFDTVSSIFDYIKKESENSMTIFTYDEIESLYQTVKCIIGDESIKVKKSGESTFYTIDLSKLTDFVGLGNVKGSTVIKEENGNYNFDFDLVLEIEELGKLSISMDSERVKNEDAIVEKVPEDAPVIDVSDLIGQDESEETE